MPAALGARREMTAHTLHRNDYAQSIPQPALVSALTSTQPNVPTLRSRNEFLMTGVIPVSPIPDSDCSICTEPLASDVVKMVACGHTYHCVCVLSWFLGSGQGNRRCCNCRELLYDADPAPGQPSYHATEVEVDYWATRPPSTYTRPVSRPTYLRCPSIDPRTANAGVGPLQHLPATRHDRFRSAVGPPVFYSPSVSIGPFSPLNPADALFARSARETHVEQSQNSDAQTPPISARRPPRGPPLSARDPPTHNLTPLERSTSRLNPLESPAASAQAQRLMDDVGSSRIHEGFRRGMFSTDSTDTIVPLPMTGPILPFQRTSVPVYPWAIDELSEEPRKSEGFGR